jgi:hypothetical protein
VAVWVEDAAGNFVRTIDRYAATRKSHLIGWIAKAGNADTDAVSGATRANHTGALTRTWDLTGRGGTEIPDGTYTIRMELADSNASTAAQNAQGTFTFVKGTAPQSQTGLANGGFTGVSIAFTPGAPSPTCVDLGDRGLRHQEVEGLVLAQRPAGVVEAAVLGPLGLDLLRRLVLGLGRHRHLQVELVLGTVMLSLSAIASSRSWPRTSSAPPGDILAISSAFRPWPSRSGGMPSIWRRRLYCANTARSTRLWATGIWLPSPARAARSAAPPA